MVGLTPNKEAGQATLTQIDCSQLLGGIFFIKRLISPLCTAFK
ncbi:MULTISPECIES: hypothetical protein [spotted fever group]|nr:hypothetical protein [Rickettsia philipii]